MTILIKKPEVIEAFQVPQEGEEPSQEMIDFLHREEIRDQWKDGNFGELLIDSDCITAIATYGQWLVLDDEGFLDVYPDYFIQHNYVECLKIKQELLGPEFEKCIFENIE